MKQRPAPTTIGGLYGVYEPPPPRRHTVRPLHLLLIMAGAMLFLWMAPTALGELYQWAAQL
jgi:hypothetical protein